jgi:hypothetical protein
LAQVPIELIRLLRRHVRPRIKAGAKLLRPSFVSTGKARDGPGKCGMVHEIPTRNPTPVP